jgi:hypothetical protein
MDKIRTVRRLLLVRRYDAGDLLDIFLVSAVSALLLVRFLLRITGYPQLGGERLHIAHLLWGGLLMMSALIILLSTQSRLPIHFCAVVGGVGFGLFIDELGKMLTRDVNYFFRPTIALIYILFILLYIASRALGRRIEPTPEASLINALELTKEAVIRDMDPTEKRLALACLERSDPSHPVVPVLWKMLNEVEVVPPLLPAPLAAARLRVRAWYNRFSQARFFSPLVLALATANAAAAVVQGFRALKPAASRSLHVDAWGQLVSSGLIFLLVVWGILSWPRSRLSAYRRFRRAALLSICVTQVFAFYRQQLGAIAGLAVSVLIWAALGYLIRQEERVSAGRGNREGATGMESGG